jgi:hypothetical protein
MHDSEAEGTAYPFSSTKDGPRLSKEMYKYKFIT